MRARLWQDRLFSRISSTKSWRCARETTMSRVLMLPVEELLLALLSFVTPRFCVEFRVMIRRVAFRKALIRSTAGRTKADCRSQVSNHQLLTDVPLLLS